MFEIISWKQTYNNFCVQVATLYLLENFDWPLFHERENIFTICRIPDCVLPSEVYPFRFIAASRIPEISSNSLTRN